LIAHSPNGGLTTFHVAMLKSVPLSAVIQRLLVNKPPLLTTPAFLLGWVLFFVSTLSLIVISRRASCANLGYGSGES
jgi:hypothetical protein